MVSRSRRACILIPEHLLEHPGLICRASNAKSTLISAAPFSTTAPFPRLAIAVDGVAEGVARGSNMTGRRSTSAGEWCKAGGR